MRGRHSVLLYGAVFVVGLGLGLGLRLGTSDVPLEFTPRPAFERHPIAVVQQHAMQTVSSGSVAPQPIQSGSSLAELVVGQIRVGDLTCPVDDAITTEACLLFQGALGTWNAVGRLDDCPPTVSGSGRPVPNPSVAMQGLSAEDVMRAPTSRCFAYLYAIQVANAVPVLVSTANRTFRVASETPMREPGADASLCLQARHGICGNQTAVGLALFDKAGFRARPLEFYYERKGVRLNHIIPEVWIGGKWHPVDTTYGAYWIRIASGKPFELGTLEEIQARPARARLFYNQALLPYGLYKAISRPVLFDYLTSNADIIRGGNGSVRLTLQAKNGIEKFTDKPNFLGDNVADGANARGLSFSLSSEPGRYELAVQVTALAVTGNQPVQLCVDDVCKALAAGDQRLEFEVAQPKSVYVKSEIDVAYAVLASIEWKRED
jgi:hypothetical protein